MINAPSAAAALFDADDWLVVANPAYRAANAVFADILRPGLRCARMARLDAAHGGQAGVRGALVMA